MLKEHVRGSEGGVSAKIHLHRRRHPPNIVEASAVDEERGLGQIIFRRDLLQECVRQPFIQHANTRRIAGKLPIRELARWYLYRWVSAGRSIPYNPADPASAEGAYKEWKKLIPDGQLPPRSRDGK